MADIRSPHAAPEEVTGKLHDLLATLWARSRQTISDRLDVLRATHRALRTNPADRNARRAGADAAHKLAGILGTFGLPDGTNLARRVELMLESSRTHPPLRSGGIATDHRSTAPDDRGKIKRRRQTPRLSRAPVPV